MTPSATKHPRSTARVPRVILILLVIGSLLISVGCGSSSRGAPLVDPVRLTDPQVLLGQSVFMAHCYQCHPGGTAGLGPAIYGELLPSWLIKFQVRNGLGVMPGFSEEQITDAELDALIAYLQKLRSSQDTKDESTPS